MSDIHPTAIVHPSAQLGEDLVVGPYAVIEADTEIGDGSTIGAHAVVKRHTRLGRRNRVFEHAVIGGDPQDLGFKPGDSAVWIGDDNVVREGVTVHRATRAGTATRIGDRNYLMAYAHIAHDCELEDEIIFANGATLGGHVHVGRRAFVSGYAAIHQFCRVGAFAMVAGLAKVTQDCLPFIITDGNPARARGLNVVGLKRGGIVAQELTALKRAYRVLLLSGLGIEEALAMLGGEDSACVRQLVEFVIASKRGFAHHRK